MSIKALEGIPGVAQTPHLQYPRENSALPRFPPPTQRLQTPPGAALCYPGTSSRRFGSIPKLSWPQAKDHKDDSLIFRAWWHPEAPEWSFHLESSECPALECCRSSAEPSQSSAIPGSSYKIPAAGKDWDMEKEIQGISPSITITVPQSCLKEGTELVFLVEILCLFLVLPREYK